jgi:hypothetical protein
VPPGRTLHIVDVENLAGHSRPTARELRDLRESYFGTITFSGNDLLIVGCDVGLVLDVYATWPGARIASGTGHDGADSALLACSNPDDVARRFDRVIIGSGDHIFASLATALIAFGVVVGVVSRTDALAASLRRAGQFVRTM